MKNTLLTLSAVLFTLFAFLFVACSDSAEKKDEKDEKKETSEIQGKVDAFADFKLTGDISHLSENQKKMLPLLFEVAQIMDDIFWTQAYGDKEELLNSLETEAQKEFVKINYGPWERLNGNEPFIEGVGEKPAGAQYYPEDMTKEEFAAFEDSAKTSLYTLIRRNEAGKLKTVWYHNAYKEQTEKAADLLKQASELAESKSFKKYLLLRAEALLTDDYLASDMAWMEMKDNDIDFVVGPIENYEDKLYSYKAAHEAFILIKDKEWSTKLQRFAELLPEMQKQLPVADKYKAETPGTDSDLGAYEAVFYAGDCNAGSKTIAINLPNDERVQLAKGSRRLQLKNSMKAKFEKILLPISKLLIAEDQQKHVKFEAFFENTMFHETAHGLGIKQTLTDKGSVREALSDVSSPMEEAKADILGLFFVTQLNEMGEFEDKDLMDNYVTFFAGIFRSTRFGVSSPHGKANMMALDHFRANDAFVKGDDGKYRVDFDNMKKAMLSLSEKILTIQGDGDYEKAFAWLKEKGKITDELQKDLDKVNDAGIPVDIRFDQGLKNLGL